MIALRYFGYSKYLSMTVCTVRWKKEGGGRFFGIICKREDISSRTKFKVADHSSDVYLMDIYNITALNVLCPKYVSIKQ